MNLPRKVQEQLERAEQLEQALRAPPAEPEDKAPETAEDADQAPEPPSPPPEKQPPPTPPADDLDHKFRTLKGKYDSEVPALRRELAEREARLADRDRDIDQLRNAVDSLQEQMQRAPADPVKATVDPKDAENFGADLVDMVIRTAGTVFNQQAGPFAAQFDKLTSRLAALEAQLRGVGEQQGDTAEQLFFAQLGQLVPDWTQINESADWLAWLGQVDPVYGHTRQAALDRARQALSATHVAAIFDAFKATKAPPRRKPAEDLGKQVAPARGAASAPPATEARVWTRAQIMNFYDRVRRGEISAADEAKYESEINAAIAEGRVA
ncbi:MAG: hypothetical protein WC972_12785 [Trueperaceae bacterium]